MILYSDFFYFSALRGELPLVVAVFRRQRRLSYLRPPLFNFLLLHQAGHRRVRPHPGLLLIHNHDGHNLLATNRSSH